MTASSKPDLQSGIAFDSLADGSMLRGQAKPQDRRTPVDLVTAEKP